MQGARCTGEAVVKLQMLRPKVATLPTSAQHQPRMAGTERIRGSALQRIRDRILYRDQGICRCETCKRTDTLKVATEVEHRTPLWAGGQEDDGNRYAIASDCHEAKTRCEARMRAAGGWLSTPCTCGRHAHSNPTGQKGAGDAHPQGSDEGHRRTDRPS